MNTSRLIELKNDLIRLQRSYRDLETVLKGFDAKQKERYAEKVRKQLFEIEETYCNAMQKRLEKSKHS
jgi:Mg2+ and Co2+ transporter CorA